MKLNMTLHLRGVLIGVAIVTVLYVIFVVVVDPYKKDEDIPGMNWGDAQLNQDEVEHGDHGDHGDDATHEMPNGKTMEGEVHDMSDM